MINEMRAHPHDFLRFSPDAVLIVNSQYKVIYANDLAYDLFGYPCEELIDMPVHHLLPRDISERHEQMQAEYFKNPRVRGIGEKQDVVGIAKDGSVLDLDIKLVPYRLENRLYAMAVVRDVSKHVELRKEVQTQSLELAELNSKLQNHNEQLLELNKVKNEFLGIAAHDMRSPLGTIMGNIEFLLEMTERDDEFLVLKDVMSVSEHMLSVINEFLDVSTLQSGEIKLNKQPCDLVNILNNSVTAMVPLAKRKKIHLQLKLDSQLPVLMLDANRIKQVIDNYLSNAIKYSYEGSKVVVSLNVMEHEVVCSVKDQGQGIEKKFLDELFQPFKQTSAIPTNGESSTGLGLYIVKSIVEKHGGKVWGESELKRGSKFFFSLPLELALQKGA